MKLAQAFFKVVYLKALVGFSGTFCRKGEKVAVERFRDGCQNLALVSTEDSLNKILHNGDIPTAMTSPYWRCKNLGVPRGEFPDLDGFLEGIELDLAIRQLDARAAPFDGVVPSHREACRDSPFEFDRADLVVYHIVIAVVNASSETIGFK